MEINVLTHEVIGSAYKVHNVLGPGFLEKVYENALKFELDKHLIDVHQQVRLPVLYEDRQIGIYFADLLVEERLVVEIKAGAALVLEHEAQLVNYLAATGIDHGLLINFGATVQVRRKFREYRQTK